MARLFCCIAIRFLITVLLIIKMGGNAYAETVELKVYSTSRYPPYNYLEDGVLKGISVDIMIATLEKVGIQLQRENIILVPWVRGLKYLSTIPNACLLTVGRTPEREEKFQWVGPFVPTGFSVIALKDRQIKISTIDALNKYRIGEQRGGSPGGEAAIKAGVKEDNFDYTGSLQQNIRKLVHGRIDVLIVEKNVAAWYIKKLALSLDDFETVYEFEEADMYFGFHKDIAETFIQKFQAVLNEFKKQKEYQKILDTYVR
jgi:ABC-type amino acid transport substrate-binding protein